MAEAIKKVMMDPGYMAECERRYVENLRKSAEYHVAMLLNNYPVYFEKDLEVHKKVLGEALVHVWKEREAKRRAKFGR